MNIRQVAIGDIVEVEQLGRGRRYAVAVGHRDGRLRVCPLDGGAIYTVNRGELVGVWARSSRTPMPAIAVDREPLAREAS